ncbi:outer kinetochore KNL1 complex subunit KNL1 isoform X2 [Myotis yumanensis]
MDGMSSETNEENDNTERPVRRRHSSILKPPRSPLRDLRDGNEIVQEPNASRNKKSSRRVSFADTIKVYQTESHMKIERKSEIAETETRENVLFIQNKTSEDNYCEITGMNTLLCAPIQTQMQQREISVTEYNHEETHSNDQTVIFSDENQMDLTASHTVMITKGLLDCTKSEKSTKTDTTSFVANLKLHTDDSRMKKELNFSMDQNTNSEKKINFNDFIKRLKTGKSNTSSTGPDKENSEIPIHSIESNKASSIHQKHVSLNVDKNNSNMTRIFIEDDDGMNFTKCYTSSIQTLVPTSTEANLREFKSDITVYGNDLMDLTINRTIQILPSADNLSEIENQTQTVMMDITTGYRTKAPAKTTVFENEPNAAFPDSPLNPKGDIHITRGHIMGTETHTVTQTSNQDVKTLAMVPESVCFSPATQDYKTLLYSTCNDAMELTKCLSSMKEEENLLKDDCNYAKMCHNPDTSSLLMEKTIYSGEDSMDITKSQTLVIDNQIFKEDQTNVQITAKPISEKEMMLQNHITMSKDEEMNVNCISVPHVSKERLQQAQADPLSTSLAGKKTVIFTGEDKGLTKSHTTNLGSQAPFASYHLAFKDASTSHSDSKSLLDEWGKKTKTHNELSRQPKIISTNILTDAWSKEIDQVLKISPYFDKVSPQPVDINQDKATSYNIVYSGGDLHKQVALGKNRNTVSCEQALFPITKLSSEGQSAMENLNTAVNSHIVKSVPDQNSKLPEPLRKSLGNPNLDCSHDKIITCSEVEENMDLTKSHTVVIGFGPSEVQELSKTNLERTVLADRPDFELFKRKSLGKIKVTSSTEESVSFLENGESDHSAAKVSQLTLLGDRSNSGPIEKAVAFIAVENIDVSTSTVWKNDKDIQKPGFLNEHLSGKSQRRKSLRLKDDKPIAFSSNDKNDMDIIQSCTMEINNKNALEDIKDSLLVPLAGTSKTVLYTSGQDDMEITRIHTTALECKTVSPVKITTRPMDNTVLFIDNHSDLEVTKSNTAFIDCQATEKILQECPKFGIVKRKTLGVSFPKDGNSVQEITKQQAQAIENKIVLQTEQEHHVIPCSNTLSGDQAQIEIIKFHSTAVDEKVMAKVVDKAYTLEKAKLESCHLNSTGKRNVDFTNNHAPAICGSSDNYSFLPNVISYVDNLEGNVMSLCDKDEKASNCPVQNDLAYANDLASEYYLKSEALPLSAPCSVLEKEKVTQTNTQGQLNDCVITVLKDQGLIKEPPNLLANQTLVYGQDLGNMTKLDSKQVSFKFPKDQMENFVHNTEHSLKQTFVDDVCVDSPLHLSTQLSPLPQQGQSIVNKGEAILSQAASKNLNILRNSSVPTCENESKVLNNEKRLTVACEKELEKNIQTAKCNTAIDFQSNSDLTKHVIQTHAKPKETSDPVIASNAASFSSGKQNLNNLNGKTEEFLDIQAFHIPPFPEQLLELVNKADSDMSIVQATERNNINTVSNNVKDDRDEENKIFHNGAETNSVPVVKDKIRRCSLGIFLPRLPNKRNCSVTGIDDLEQIPSNTTDLSNLETQPVSSKDSGIGFIAAKLNLSPSQYINEENLPMYPGEINSSDSISIETEGKSLMETYQKEISPSENKMKETCNSQKRTWVQEEDDDTQNEKKIRKSEIKFSDTTQDQQTFYHAEGDTDKNANSVLIKSLGRTPSSCSSSLDSIKADGTSLDFSTYRNSQMEPQFLTDTVCEESLKEKLKDGRITIKEFFILLQVHILIQKPRQSTLPTKFTINTQPTPEDLMLSQYVYRPKIQIYREDCEALRQKIEELKLSVLNQDKLLTDVNRNLWGKMRHCSDEELKAFGIYLNKIKSHFTKMTKIFTHQGKVTLYSKLVQSAQNEREKLQLKIDEMDNILKKIANCLTQVKIESKNLENEEKDNPVEEWDSEMRAAEKELEQLKTEEEKLQRNLSELEVQKEQTLAQIDFMQKQTNTTEELLDQLSLSEWDVTEWSDDQAVFTFLYDTVELTITFGEPVVGLPFLNKANRRIVDLNFQSLLDEDKAPPSSLLVHKLIFQYIEEQESWKKKCTTQHQVSKMLQEISLVVSHCRLLGEEIEFLKRWGPNYNLMNIDVNNTELRLLFSSSAAFAKFEITLSLSAHYPSVLLPFSIKNHLGNISHDEISALLSKVPLEDNYLKNVVKQIYQHLLQGCNFHQETLGPQL